METILENLNGVKETVLSLLLKNIEDAVFILNKENVIVTANEAAIKRLPQAKGEVVGNNFTEIFKDFQEYFAGILEKKADVKNLKVKFKNKAGKDTLLKSTVLFCKNAVAEVSNVIIILKDTGDLDEMEDYVKQVDRLATLGQLSASMAHEIRNPLAGISTTAQVLRGKLDDTQREFIDVILSEINRLDNIVKELLDFARPNKTFKQPCNVHQILDKVLVLVDGQFNKFRIEVTKEYTKAEDALVLADFEQLMQAFLNILLNAVAAMSKGGELFIRTTLIENMLRIEFADTGCGISKEKMEDLFEPFFTTKTRGVGLGLTVTKKIIEKHKGEIRVESEEGRGASFFITIPRLRE